MTNTRVRVRTSLEFGAAAILLAYMTGRWDAIESEPTVSLLYIGICLFLVIIPPVIADTYIKGKLDG